LIPWHWGFGLATRWNARTQENLSWKNEIFVVANNCFNSHLMISMNARHEPVDSLPEFDCVVQLQISCSREEKK